MKENNITCIQSARFIFEFFEKREWKFGEESPLKNIINTSDITAQSVRELGDFLSNRLERIAEMMEILKEAHNDWTTVGKKNKIIMETESFDFNEAIEVLKEKKFRDEEYILEVEYKRKWGML